MDKFDMTIVIPVYNMEKYIDYCLQSVIAQDYDLNKIQVVIINDGSKDGSKQIIEKYIEKYNNFELIDSVNEGVAAARNKGIKAAKGKYIIFLDPDDYINSCTVKTLVNFYDKHYDEVELVSYKIIAFDDVTNKMKDEHFRYNFLIKEGIYDLTNFENIYANITTINYCVKNKYDENTLFDGNLKWQEDQEYSIRLLKDNLKIGYCPDAIYYYRNFPNNTTGSKKYAYYIFDGSMNFWEKLFNSYEKEVPEYFQALFMNDCGWKLREGVLHPYHYQDEEYDKQWLRVRKLLDRVNDRVILNHPNVDKLYRYYFITQKTNKNIDVEIADHNPFFAIYNNKQIIYAGQNLDVSIIKLAFEGKYIKLSCVCESPLFLFSAKPTILCYKNNRKYGEIDVRESAHSYSKSKEKTAKSYYFKLKVDTDNLESINLKVCINSNQIDVNFSKLLYEDIDKSSQFMRVNDKLIYTFLNDKIKVEKATKKALKEYNRISSCNILKKRICILCTRLNGKNYS